MPLLRPVIESIAIPVADRILEGTHVKQVAFFDEMRIKQMPGGTWIYLNLTVRLYAVTAQGGQGAELNRKGFSSYPVTLVADNSTAVDPATGDMLYIRISERLCLDFLAGQVVEMPTPAQGVDRFEHFLDNQAQDMLLQDAFFNVLRDTQDVRIRNLIVQNILQANAMGTHFA